jgi:hypothetical protein
MSKRLGVKLAVMVATVSAMTLLQGCDGDQDDSVVSSAWTPVGYPWTLYNYAGVGQSAAGGSSQSAGAASSGGAAVAGAISSARGGGGGQVSAGGAM